ncbi:hypothetical protein Gotri_024294 [Gossypium trilobum]|uniref:F-box domain-containing protein n=1 Tax=Gossypium trilobum TaxID=34281 RepID=A0A7J9DLX8_9ROSI|nr:hypothetical protein [Gossypium trilobum]
MSRRVRQKREHSWGEKTNISSETLDCGSLASATISGVDWTTLPDDSVIQLLSYLNYRDRAIVSFRIGFNPRLLDNHSKLNKPVIVEEDAYDHQL